MKMILFGDHYIRADLVTCVTVDACTVYVDTSCGHRYSYHGCSPRDAKEKAALFVTRLEKA